MQNRDRGWGNVVGKMRLKSGKAGSGDDIESLVTSILTINVVAPIDPMADHEKLIKRHGLG